MSNAARHVCQAEASPVCEVCGVPVIVQATGRPRRYCGNRCKQKAVRNRRILFDVLTEIELIRLGLEPIDWSDEEHRVA